VTDAATEKFAALLRELKQRSGRSYGSLAARLHVSTSTLHRYCNGDAVPSSYAPAERLARLCGATPEELVELHRRWHRANGTRRGATPSWAAGADEPAGGRPGSRSSGSPRRGTPAAGARGTGTAGRSPGVRGGGPAGRGADAGDVSDATGDTPATRGGSSNRGVTAGAAAAAVPSSTGEGPGGAGAHADADDVPGAVDSAGPGGEPTGSGDVTGSGEPRGAVDKSAPTTPGSGARGRWRRRRVLVPAVGAAAAALVALVATSSGSTGEGRAAGGEGPESAALTDGSRGGGDAKGGETSEKGGSAEPSERRKPSPAGGGAGQDGEAGAAPRKGGATDEDRAEPAARTPLAWSVRSHVWENGCDHRYVLDKSPDDVPPPPMAQDAEAWAGSQGAVHGGLTNIEAAIEPRGDEQVTITAVHVRKTATGTPLPWNAFAMSDGCGGEVTEAAYSVDLDVPRPVLKPQQGADSTQKWDPPALPYRVTPDDPLSLLIHANTEDYDVRWYLEVEWSSGDDSGVIRIDDRGAPFRTSAIKDRPLYGYDTLNGSWRPYLTSDDPAQDSASPTP
jgi:plasmid maintenance system antidote protein VapI